MTGHKCPRFGILSIRLQGSFLVAPHPPLRSMELKLQIAGQWPTLWRRLLEESPAVPLNLWKSKSNTPWIFRGTRMKAIIKYSPWEKCTLLSHSPGNTSPGPDNNLYTMLQHLRENHTSWGADRAILLYLYQALIRLILGNWCEVYSSATAARLRILSSIYHDGGSSGQWRI